MAYTELLYQNTQCTRQHACWLRLTIAVGAVLWPRLTQAIWSKKRKLKARNASHAARNQPLHYSVGGTCIITNLQMPCRAAAASTVHFITDRHTNALKKCLSHYHTRFFLKKNPFLAKQKSFFFLDAPVKFCNLILKYFTFRSEKWFYKVYHSLVEASLKKMFKLQIKQ